MTEEEFARHRLGPNGKPLRIWPPPKKEDFESDDEFWEYLDAISRYHNNRPPKVPPPATEGRAGPMAGGKGVSCKVGIRLTPHDHQLLMRLADEHAVTPSTMARILVAKGLRSALGGAAKDG